MAIRYPHALSLILSDSHLIASGFILLSSPYPAMRLTENIRSAVRFVY